MGTLVKHSGFVTIFVVSISLCGASVAENSDVGTRKNLGLEINCGEAKVLITAKKKFFEERNVPFRPEFLRLGANAASCGPTAASQARMLISAGLRECGAESHVRKLGKNTLLG